MTNQKLHPFRTSMSRQVFCNTCGKPARDPAHLQDLTGDDSAPQQRAQVYPEEQARQVTAQLRQPLAKAKPTKKRRANPFTLFQYATGGPQCR